jgi:hypothetical protein
MSKIINYNANRYPTPNGSGLVVLAVLCERIEGTFKVYAAIVPDVSTSDPDYDSYKSWVQKSGHPLRYKEAICHFPFLREDVYAK